MTEAVPDEFVIAITLLPLEVPLESVPAEVVNKMPAPLADPPDWPGETVTVNGKVSAAPALPVWLLPDCVSIAAGFPTTIHPPCVWVTVPSLPVTVKWQNPGVLPAFTVIAPGCATVIVEFVSMSEPPHADVP